MRGDPLTALGGGGMGGVPLPNFTYAPHSWHIYITDSAHRKGSVTGRPTWSCTQYVSGFVPTVCSPRQ